MPRREQSVGPCKSLVERRFIYEAQPHSRPAADIGC